MLWRPYGWRCVVAGDTRLVRRPDQGMISGVAAGVAASYNIDVTLVRLAFVGVAILSVGLGVIGYIAAAALIPREGDEPGIDSVRHNAADLMTRGKELYGETKKAIDRKGSSGQPGTGM